VATALGRSVCAASGAAVGTVKFIVGWKVGRATGRKVIDAKRVSSGVGARVGICDLWTTGAGELSLDCIEGRALQGGSDPLQLGCGVGPVDPTRSPVGGGEASTGAALLAGI